MSEAKAKLFNLLFASKLNCKTGLICGDNERYIRTWFEVDSNSIGTNMESFAQATASKYTWFPYNHGGKRRKWYGNHLEIVCFEVKTHSMKAEANSAFRNVEFYFKRGITWNRIGSGYHFAARIALSGFVFDDVSPSGFLDENRIYYTLGLMNSPVFKEYLSMFSTNVKTEIGHIQRVPYVESDRLDCAINQDVKQSITYSTKDWDSFETSWDFKKHPMI